MMNSLVKRAAPFVLALLMLTTAGLCLAEETEVPFQPIYPLRADAPALTSYGLLPEDSAVNHYLVQDVDAGEWTYIDHQMFINIRRFKDVVERKRNLIWYETEVKVAPGVKFVTQHANPEAIGRRFMWAEELATKLNSILAISDDFYGFRVYAKRTPGVIIQNGEILANESLKKPHWTLPTYDLIAYFPDGSMKTYLAGSIDAEELLDMGATDTWCFGPVLLSNGQIGQQVLDKQFEYINPRMALGMIEPNHYFIMTAEGRHKNSDGVGLTWIAEQMRDRGCTEALNLDGGNSIKLVFMGEILNSQRHYNKKNDRTVTSLITLGTFPLDTLKASKATNTQATNTQAASQAKDTKAAVQSESDKAALQAQYDAAAALYEAQEYEQALSAFQALGSYADSRKRATESKEKWQDQQYTAAVTLYKAENYREALPMFKALGSYRESKRFASKCEQGILKLDYAQATEWLEAGRYADARKLFLSLGSYSNSAKRAQEAADLLAAEEKAARELEAYEQGVAYRAAGELEKARDAFILSGGCKDASAQLYEVAETLAVKNMYRRAALCVRNGVYEKAQKLFAMLGDYEDSAEQAAQAGGLHQAALYAEAAGAAQSNPALARILFTYLGEYEDSAERAQALTPAPEALYAAAEALEDAFRLSEALTGYRLADYKDSEKQAAKLEQKIQQEATFESAQMLSELARYEESNALFKTLGTYKNADRMGISRLSAARFRDDATTELSDVFVAPDGSRHRYRIYKGVHLWIEAKAFCEVLGGHLATLTTPEENEFVYWFMRDNGFLTAYWGLEDEARVGNWRWVTDEPFVYTNWHSGEPSRSGRERYGMYFYKHLKGTWNDAHFYEYAENDPGCSFICEWDLE